MDIQTEIIKQGTFCCLLHRSGADLGLNFFDFSHWFRNRFKNRFALFVKIGSQLRVADQVVGMWSAGAFGNRTSVRLQIIQILRHAFGASNATNLSRATRSDYCKKFCVHTSGGTSSEDGLDCICEMMLTIFLTTNCVAHRRCHRVLSWAQSIEGRLNFMFCSKSHRLVD